MSDCARGHSMDDEANVYVLPDGRRRCRACRLEYRRVWRARKRAGLVTEHVARTVGRSWNQRAHQRLTEAMATTTPACADDPRFTSGDVLDYAEATRVCLTCPLYDPCADVGRDATAGVWAAAPRDLWPPVNLTLITTTKPREAA